MAIKAKFCVYTGNPKRISKLQWNTAGWATGEIEISAWEEIDDLTCDFILDGAGYHAYNYMAVDWGNIVKYYFLEQRTGLPANMTKIRATCDVLSTYRNVIYRAPAIINRTSWNTGETCDPMLRDNKVTTTSKTIVSTEPVQTNIIGAQEWFYVGVLQSSVSVGEKIT